MGRRRHQRHRRHRRQRRHRRGRSYFFLFINLLEISYLDGVCGHGGIISENLLETWKVLPEVTAAKLAGTELA